MPGGGVIPTHKEALVWVTEGQSSLVRALSRRETTKLELHSAVRPEM
jgi:hypothetical protein